VVDGFVVNCLTHELTAAEVTAALEKQKRLSKTVPSDYGGKFKEQWKEWCRVEIYFARPSHPKDKGEVERRVQNLNGEFIYNLGKFPEWLKGKRVAILGLAFKADTDDMREARVIPIINQLIKEGANVTAYDPAAIPTAKTSSKTKSNTPHQPLAASKTQIAAY
jgi:hypothetical protein